MTKEQPFRWNNYELTYICIDDLKRNLAIFKGIKKYFKNIMYNIVIYKVYKASHVLPDILCSMYLPIINIKENNRTNIRNLCE